MSKYKEIKGFKVQTLASDTVTSQALVGSWASGGSLNTTRALGLGSGTQTAALMAGGYTSPPYSAKTETELYNGSSWTEVADLNTGKSGIMGGGTQTSAIGASGSTAESWNGSAWTEVADLNTSRSGGGGVGQSSSAAFVFGGYIGPPRSAAAEQWNGSSWTEVGDLNSAKDEQASVGTTTSALSVGGTVTAVIAENESWNGSAWTEVADLNTARSGVTGSGDDNTTGIVFGGYNPGGANGVAVTESWDGSSWTEVSDLTTARKNGTPAGYPGGQNAALMIAGITTTQVATVEEWTTSPSFQKLNLGQVYFNSTANAFKVTEQPVASGTWASGGSLNDARSQVGGVGTQTAAICIGGNTPPETANVETYDGSSWTEVNNLNTGRRLTQGMGTVYTSAFAVGGYYTPGYQSIVESWNGTSWTETTDTNSAKGAGGQAGTSTAGIAFAGVPPAPMATNEHWNGSSWTELNDLNTGRRNIGSAGTVYTAAIAFGGDSDPTPGGFNNAEVWDGSTWTEVNNLNTTRTELASAGTSTLALGSGGNPPVTGKTEAWDGTSWTEVADLATSRRELNSQSSNSQTSALVFGGSAPPYSSATEEFTAADFTINPVTTS